MLKFRKDNTVYVQSCHFIYPLMENMSRGITGSLGMLNIKQITMQPYHIQITVNSNVKRKK